jgi:hypothetical protein
MKKLVLILLILMTFLFVTSCDKKEVDNNESVSNVESSDIDQSSNINDNENKHDEEVVTEATILNLENSYYPLLSGVNYLGNDFEQVYGCLQSEPLYKIITTYEEFLTLVENADQIDAKIFDENYVFVFYEYNPPFSTIGRLLCDGTEIILNRQEHETPFYNSHVFNFLIVPKAHFSENVKTNGTFSIFGSTNG